MELPYWGPKTVDYLKILVGSQAVAVDSRILRFLGSAGLLISAGTKGNISRAIREVG